MNKILSMETELKKKVQWNFREVSLLFELMYVCMHACMYICLYVQDLKYICTTFCAHLVISVCKFVFYERQYTYTVCTSVVCNKQLYG